MILLAAAALAAAPWEVPQQRVALPDGRHINLYCTGTGGPTVVLEAGFGGTSWAWSTAQPLIARSHRVCSYDRAGMGFSDPGPLPRDARAIIADLAATLKAARVAPPYLLVGHSAGAMTMRLYADAHPGDVAGLVLVDPSIEGQFDEQGAAVDARVAQYERCAAAATAQALPSADAGLARCTPAMAAYSLAWVCQYAGVNADLLNEGRQSYGDLPLVVLTAGVSATADPRWEARHAALAARSSRGVQHTIAGASHNLMRDAPAAVAAAVEETER